MCLRRAGYKDRVRRARLDSAPRAAVLSLHEHARTPRRHDVHDDHDPRHDDDGSEAEPRALKGVVPESVRGP